MQAISGDKYDADASDRYVSAAKSNFIFQYVQDYSFLHYLGDVQGKSVLDIGCGNGCYSRSMKQKGASRVVGVDLSDAMIRICKKEEHCRPMGLEYQVADCTTMGKLGEFDLVLANFVLVYASSVQELEAFVRNLYLNVKPGGRFVGVNVTSLEKFPFDNMATKYGRSFEKMRDFPGGAEFRTGWLSDGGQQQLEDFSIVNYTFEESAYREVFEAVGFKAFTFNPPLLSEEGRRAFPEGFWDEYLEKPHISVFTATKD